MKNNIFFSSDNKKFNKKDLDETSKISKEYFKTEEDASQIQITLDNKNWILKNVPEYLNIIKNNKETIGYAFLLPCNKSLMEDFINKKIDEAMLFEGIKKIKLKKVPETIYLCASVIKEEFRGKGLASSAFVKVINKITLNLKEKPILFCWEYSEEGGKLARKIANITGLELRVRK